MHYFEFALKYKGVVGGSKKHHDIVDYYNEQKPLPRSYKVSYKDSWCAVFVSFVLHHFDVVNPPFECSANRMYLLCKNNKQIVRVPRLDDIVFYSWRCNGYVNHVGIVSKVDGNTLTVIEGNKSNKVACRQVQKDCIYIQAFARVKRAKK